VGAHQIIDRILSAVVICLLGAAPFITSCGGDEKPLTQSSVSPEAALNNRVRTDLPATGVVPNIKGGVKTNRDSLVTVAIAPGVTAKIVWGTGVMMAWLTFEPGARIPWETLPSERLMVVWEGEVEQFLNGDMKPMRSYIHDANLTSMPHKQFIYMPAGAANAEKAGPEGATILEIYSPVRADYIRKAGGTVPVTSVAGSFGSLPNFPAYTVMDINDVQFTPFDADRTLNSRLIWGEQFMAGFLSMEEDSESAEYRHPEEELMMVLGGRLDQTINGVAATLTAGDIVYLPGGLAHYDTASVQGAEIIHLFWPPRNAPGDYTDKTMPVYDAFHEFIPAGTSPEMVHDGETGEPRLRYAAGPSWVNSELFFSNRWFEDDFKAASPDKSQLIRMNADGGFTTISQGMLTGGTAPLANDNLVVCDLSGPRVIEMNRTGKIVRVIAEQRADGTKIEGADDLVIDRKGGIYLSGCQLTPYGDANPAGGQVYYRKPSGGLAVVVKTGEMGQPAGILMSPDGKNAYIANTRNQPFGYWAVKADVNSDGTLSNLRPWAKLHVPPSSRQAVSDRKMWYSGADGMTMDTEGNVYIATRMGLQIFTPDGAYVGMVATEVPPTGCVFGGPRNDTIYMTCATQIWKVRTNKKGFGSLLK
jgi:gluconolactonase